jgi:hypothetical protein
MLRDYISEKVSIITSPNDDGDIVRKMHIGIDLLHAQGEIILIPSGDNDAQLIMRMKGRCLGSDDTHKSETTINLKVDDENSPSSGYTLFKMAKFNYYRIAHMVHGCEEIPEFFTKEIEKANIHNDYYPISYRITSETDMNLAELLK